jgi:hypothetical protein
LEKWANGEARDNQVRKAEQIANDATTRESFSSYVRDLTRASSQELYDEGYSLDNLVDPYLVQSWYIWFSMCMVVLRQRSRGTLRMISKIHGTRVNITSRP